MLLQNNLQKKASRWLLETCRPGVQKDLKPEAVKVFFAAVKL